MNGKRKRDDEDGPGENDETIVAATPKKARIEGLNGTEQPVAEERRPEIATPTPQKRRGRPPGSKNKPKPPQDDAIGILEAFSPAPYGSPTPKGKRLFTTPKKARQDAAAGTTTTPKIVRNADRSARKKSARALIHNSLADELGEEDELAAEDDLARRIWDEDGENVDGQDVQLDVDETLEAGSTVAETPSKRGRGRPKGSKNRTPTPPPNMPPYEQYFWDNRSGGIKTSNNTLSSLSLLTHEEYFNLIKDYKDPHEAELAFLQELHSRSFNQWAFELQEGFNLCLYGYGSKRTLTDKLASWIYNNVPEGTEKPIIVVVNGYAPNVTIREVLNTIASAIIPNAHNQKLGSQPAEILDSIQRHLLDQPPEHPITIIINSIDASPLRRPLTQNLLARLAALQSVHLIATADTPSFGLLWDSSLREQYNFLFHDCTSFQPFDAELAVVDDAHELFGRSGRRVGGKDGVAFVLRSLPENARNLFRVLVAEQLAAMEEGLDGADGEDDGETGAAGMRGSGGETGVEYRLLYQKAVEEFICSSEMAFRTLLKEFHDHQMISSRKEALGSELLWAPFRKDELEAILEDLVE